MNSVFSQSELKFCSVPIPEINAHKNSEFDFTVEQISNYKQSQTHPSIVYVPDGWNGHKYWLATTPYPAAVGVFENTCVYYGDEDADGNPPTVFHPISGGVANGEYTVTTNPIVKVDSTNTVNSDCDLILLNNIMWSISRHNNDKHKVYSQKSVDGMAWTPRGTIPVWSDDIQPYGAELVSPSLLLENGEIKAYCLKGSVGATTPDYENNKGLCFGLDILKGTTLEGSGDFAYHQRGVLYGNRKIEPWHFDVFKDDTTGKYYAIMSASNRNFDTTGLKTYLAESDDGVNFYMYGLPLIQVHNQYRPTAFIREDRKLVLYFSTYGYPTKDLVKADMLPNGASDFSTDGRYIGLAVKDFDDILETLKKSKYTNYTKIM